MEVPLNSFLHANYMTYKKQFVEIYKIWLCLTISYRLRVFRAQD